jgi:hypothetical protein
MNHPQPIEIAGLVALFPFRETSQPRWYRLFAQLLQESIACLGKQMKKRQGAEAREG